MLMDFFGDAGGWGSETLGTSFCALVESMFCAAMGLSLVPTSNVSSGSSSGGMMCGGCCCDDVDSSGDGSMNDVVLMA